MAIRLPLTTVLDVTNTDLGAASLIGGYAYPFRLPQDTDNVVVKFSPSVTGAGISAIFQSSDDGGTTYYDVARTSIASNSGAFNGVYQLSQFMSIPTIGQATTRASVVAVGSTIAVNTIGSAGASTLGTGQYSGIPILGIQNRIFMVTTGGATANNSRVQVYVNQQSASA